jgi:hypothetical protein
MIGSSLQLRRMPSCALAPTPDRHACSIDHGAPASAKMQRGTWQDDDRIAARWELAG